MCQIKPTYGFAKCSNFRGPLRFLSFAYDLLCVYTWVETTGRVGKRDDSKTRRDSYFVVDNKNFMCREKKEFDNKQT